MNSILNILLLLLTGGLMLPVILLLVQVLAALLPRRPASIPNVARPRIAVLIPAHNESTGILKTLKSVQSQLIVGDRLLIVADNCSDDTASIARAAGAEVVERNDESLRGKGYALEYGMSYLANDPPELVVIVDADCIVESAALNRLAVTCSVLGRPVQALYLMTTPPGAGPMAPIAEFAWIVKNHVRPLGYHRLGQPCQLMGTGMAFPWHVLRKLSLGSGHIVEDLKMGIELADAGFAPVFCPDALVTSTFPASKEGTKSQRTRWEHGHIGMIVGEAPRYFLRACKSTNFRLLAMVVDMCIPPLALLLLAVITSCLVGIGYYGIAKEITVLQVSIATLICLSIAILIAWVRFGRQVLSFGRLAYAPLYAIRKIPVYMKFLVHRQVDWIRSKRDHS